MTVNRSYFERMAILGASLLFLVSCNGERETTAQNMEEASAPIPSNVSQADVLIDERIRAQVASAVVNASDLPPGFDVQVSEGVVQIKGSVICDDCGGMRTPGHIGTIQQLSLIHI